ncbi:DUF1924 domain-containing protein [Ghiorsea bivora]|uniref:DUF1924 domain-containing protein n=1 Tax=Ghiorsea bivora TaxID=1485545 RepID=UPI00068ADFE5|nr:DUF1924 domain-containing protein [Ghiorsea bivora]
MKKTLMLAAALWMTPLVGNTVGYAAEGGSAIPEMMAKFEAEGASNFSAEAGKKMWTKVMPFEHKGEMMKDRSCATCHGVDLTKPGKHAKTGKEIAPMTLSGVSVNRKGEQVPRFSEAKKIKKWFKRNCKWTYGRECTAQEKGNFLAFFKSFK